MPINPYNPLSNLPEDVPDAVYSGGPEAVGDWHWDQGNGVLEEIAQKNPELADQLGQYTAHMLAALNAYHHDIFERQAPPSSEDLETRIRKNR